MDERERTPDVMHYLRAIYRRRYPFVLAAAAIIAAITCVSYMLPRIYEASTTVSIEKNYLNVLMRDVAATTPTDDRVQALSIVMTSRSMLARVLADLGVALQSKDGTATEKLLLYFQKRTVIKFDANRSGRSNMELFTVTYRDRDPRFARDYVNALVSRYVVDSLSRKRNEARGANRFVYEQMELYKTKIDNVERELKARKGRRDVQAVTRLAELRKRHDDLLAQYTERHPEVLRLKAEIETTQEQVRRLERAETAQNGDDGGAEQPKIPAAAGRGIADLERDRDAYRKIYEALVASVGRSEVSAQVEAQDNREGFNVLEPAVLPIEPVSRPRWQIILLGVVAGIVGGAAVALGLDMTDRTIKTVWVLKGLGFPIIGLIPRIENAAMLAAKKRRDLVLYSAAGVYVAAILALAAVEFVR